VWKYSPFPLLMYFSKKMYLKNISKSTVEIGAKGNSVRVSGNEEAMEV
jgi:hypothetical protein